MNILFLNHNIRGRGTWFRCYHFAKELSHLGHSVTVLTLSADPRAWGKVVEDGAVRVIESPRWLSPGKHDGGWAPLDIAYRLLPVLGHRWDLVHAFDHRPNVSIPWYLVKWLRRTHCLADWSDWWTRGGIITERRRWQFLDRLEARLEEGSKRSAEAVTVISSVLRDRALSLGIPEERVFVIPPGAPVDDIRMEDKSTCRQNLGLSLNRPILSFVGHALWDLRMLLEAFARVRRSNPEVRLLLAGKDKDNVLPSLMVETDAGEGVISLGEVPSSDLSIALGAADVHLLPLRDNLANRARWPNKLGDYLASGRPCVVQDVGDTPGFVREHQVGLVAEPNAESFARAILDLISSPERCEQLGRQARRVAEEVIPCRRSAEALDQIYHRLVRKAKDQI